MKRPPLAVIAASLLTTLAALSGSQQFAIAQTGANIAGDHAYHLSSEQAASYTLARSTCAHRPPIRVSTNAESGRLRVQITATTSPEVPTNALQIVRFGSLSNARIVSPDQGVFSTPRVITLAPPVGAYVFYVERVAERNVTVSLTVTDVCGDWSTFVGGGASIFTPPVPIGDVLEGVPICTDHSATVWHPLVKRNGTTITCTYGHEHHADPNSVNDIFGAPSAWYGGAQAISYPWQTSSSLGLENAAKHEGYKWYVQRDMPCRPNGDASYTGCFRSFRIQTHTMGTASDAVSRFHSFSIEAVVEFNGQVGMLRSGGWLDFDHLSLNVDGGAGVLCPPLTTNPPSFDCGQNAHRSHASANVPPPYSPRGDGAVAWYANHRTTSLSTGFENFGPIDYQNPAQQLFFDPALRANNSQGGIGNLSLDGQTPWIEPLQVHGYATFNGYLTADGATIANGCSAPGPTCVPTQLTNVGNVMYLYRADVQAAPNQPPPNIEYDVPSPSTGKSLIRFPN